MNKDFNFVPFFKPILRPILYPKLISHIKTGILTFRNIKNWLIFTNIEGMASFVSI